MSVAVRPKNITLPFEEATVHLLLQPRIEFVEPGVLDDPLIVELYEIYARHYRTTPESFTDRIRKGIDLLTIFRTPSGDQIVGFTGLRLRRFELSNGSHATTMYLGMSTIESEWRGRLLIQRMVIRMFLELLWLNPREPIYVWSDSLTVRPYLLSARNLAEYYPSPFWETPPQVQEVRQLLGKTYYGDAFDTESGVVHKKVRVLEAHELQVDEKSLDDPHVRFYLEQNPGYINGNGLLIIQPATFQNVRFFLGIQGRRKLNKLMSNISFRAESIWEKR